MTRLSVFWSAFSKRREQPQSNSIQILTNLFINDLRHSSPSFRQGTTTWTPNGIQSKNEDIRLAVRKLIPRTSPFELTTYPIPTPPKKEGEKSGDASPAAASAEPSPEEPTPSDSTIPPQDEEVATAAAGSTPSDVPTEPSPAEEDAVTSSNDQSNEEAAPAQVEEKKPAAVGWNPMSWLVSTSGTARAADSNGTRQNVEAVQDEMVEVER